MGDESAQRFSGGFAQVDGFSFFRCCFAGERHKLREHEQRRRRASAPGHRAQARVRRRNNWGAFVSAWENVTPVVPTSAATRDGGPKTWGSRPLVLTRFVLTCAHTAVAL